MTRPKRPLRTDELGWARIDLLEPGDDPRSVEDRLLNEELMKGGTVENAVAATERKLKVNLSRDSMADFHWFHHVEKLEPLKMPRGRIFYLDEHGVDTSEWGSEEQRKGWADELRTQQLMFPGLWDWACM